MYCYAGISYTLVIQLSNRSVERLSRVSTVDGCDFSSLGFPELLFYGLGLRVEELSYGAARPCPSTVSEGDRDIQEGAGGLGYQFVG